MTKYYRMINGKLVEIPFEKICEPYETTTDENLGEEK